MTTYSELMVAAHKAESKTEEAWDKVRAKSAVITSGYRVQSTAVIAEPPFSLVQSHSRLH